MQKTILMSVLLISIAATPSQQRLPIGDVSGWRRCVAME